MALQNEWIRYIDRTYQQIKDRVLTDLQALTPEITDHTESNPFVKMLSIWAGIAEMLGYYIDNSAREAHLSTARLYKSGILISKGYDYRVHAYLPSTGNATFMIDSVALVDIVIPLNTEVESDTGLLYYTVDTATILAGELETTVSIKQFAVAATAVLGTADGTANKIFVITGKLVDSSSIIKVGGIAWQAVNTFGYSYPTDTVYVQSVNQDKQPIILFGDGINGAIPVGAVTMDYQETEGEAGNTGAETISNINSNITTPTGTNLSVINRQRTSGGSGVESLAKIKSRVPKSIRTLMRAVTKQDYIDIAEIKTGIARAGVEYDCGKFVNVYVVPDGGGIASITLLADTQVWMDYYKMVTTSVKVLPAGEIRLLFDIDLTVRPQYTRAVVTQQVIDNITSFLSFKNQTIGGEVQLSDIYEIIENTEGVRHSSINKMSPAPYARPLDSNILALNWTKSLLPASTITEQWEIKFIALDKYELSKGSTYIGVYTVGDTVNTAEITIQVNTAAYAIGMRWQFYTYPFFGTVDIIEPSLPVSLPSDITLNATGGL